MEVSIAPKSGDTTQGFARLSVALSVGEKNAFASLFYDRSSKSRCTEILLLLVASKEV